jgi:hypothetical protein
MRSNQQFVHRPLRSGLQESICLRCFRTVGLPGPESALGDQEASHVCNPEDLITLRGRIEPQKATSPQQGEETA